MQIKHYLFLIILITISCSKTKDNKNKIDTNKDKNEIYESRSLSFEDTLTKFVGLQNLEEFIKENEEQNIEIIRLVKSIFAFNLNRITVIEMQTQNQRSKLVGYELKFDLNCNFPHLKFEDEKHFTSNCFQLINKNELILNERDTKELKKLIQQTGLLSTKYLERGKMLCDGGHYSIRFVNPMKLGKEIFSIERSCPSTQMAISLVSEELIRISKNVDKK